MAGQGPVGAARPVAPARGHVVVDGRAPVALESVLQLRRSGVDVRGGWHAGDAAELAVAGGTPPPALVVLAAEAPLRPWSAAPWQARGVAHLPVEHLAAALAVGPLVLPGRSACLRCVLGSRPATPPADPTGPGLPGPPGAPAVVLAAAVVTVTALAVLRGDESLAGISTEIGPGATTVTHRLWPALPDCRCSSERMAG
jgi:hypothetical protein